MLIEINQHAVHSTAVFLELSIAFSALSLRALNAINHTVGAADITTEEVVTRQNKAIDSFSGNFKSAKGAAAKGRVIWQTIGAQIMPPPRKALAFFAKSILVLALITLCFFGAVHFTCSNEVYFCFSLVLCVLSVVVASKSDQTKIRAEVGKVAETHTDGLKNFGKHHTGANTEE